VRRILVVDAAWQMARFVADAVEAVLGSRPEPVIGVATGSSPLPAYRELARRHRSSPLPVAGAWWVLVDEYLGLPCDHPQRYCNVIRRELLDALGVSADRLVAPDVDGADPPQVALAYEERLRTLGGVDVQILGLGSNGHLAFAEPGTPLDSRTHVVALDTRTRSDNARFFASADEVPRRAITQGLGTLLDARRLVVIAFGEGKRSAVEAAMCGPLDPGCPASVLRQHGDVTLVLDRASRGTWVTPDGWEHDVASQLPAP
jgi:glucosamine-6-phosphate deaminase